MGGPFFVGTRRDRGAALARPARHSYMIQPPDDAALAGAGRLPPTPGHRATMTRNVRASRRRSYVPPRVVTNDELRQWMDTSDE